MKDWITSAATWALDHLRGFYPFMVCFVGGLILMAHEEIGGLVAMLIASFCFAWALDLAATRAEAKARSHTAAQLTALLVSGGDTTVTIDINHNA